MSSVCDVLFWCLETFFLCFFKEAVDCPFLLFSLRRVTFLSFDCFLSYEDELNGGKLIQLLCTDASFLSFDFIYSQIAVNQFVFL